MFFITDARRINIWNTKSNEFALKLNFHFNNVKYLVELLIASLLSQPNFFCANSFNSVHYAQILIHPTSLILQRQVLDFWTSVLLFLTITCTRDSWKRIWVTEMVIETHNRKVQDLRISMWGRSMGGQNRTLHLKLNYVQKLYFFELFFTTQTPKWSFSVSYFITMLKFKTISTLDSCLKCQTDNKHDDCVGRLFVFGAISRVSGNLKAVSTLSRVGWMQSLVPQLLHVPVGQESQLVSAVPNRVACESHRTMNLAPSLHRGPFLSAFLHQNIETNSVNYF